MKLEAAEDLFLACVAQAPAYLDHSLVTDEHLSPRAKRISVRIRELRGDGWPVVTPELLAQGGGLDLGTIPARFDSIDQATLPRAEKALINAWAQKEMASIHRRAAVETEEKGLDAGDQFFHAETARIRNQAFGVSWRTVREILREYLNEIEHQRNSDTRPTTGSEDIDRAFRHWQGKMLTVLAGYTGEGKSKFAIQTLSSMAICGTRCTYIGLEDAERIPATRVMQMLYTSDFAVRKLSAEPWRLTPTEIVELQRFVDKMIKTDNLQIADITGATTDKICSAILEAARVHKSKVVCVDYVQRIQDRSLNRKDAIAAATKDIKDAAKSVGVHLILISQLRRPHLKDGDTKPPRPNRYMLKECVTGESLVMDATTGRLRTIRDIAQDSTGLSVHALHDQWEIRPAALAEAWSTGVKPVFKLRTKSGRTIRATANHPFRLFSGWTELSKLKEGQRIAVPRCLPEPAGGSDTLSDGELRLLGYLISDGHYGAGHTCSFTSGDHALIEDAREIVKRFGIVAKDVSSNGNSEAINFPNGGKRGNKLIAWLKDLGIHGDMGTGKVAPDILLHHSNRALGVFLGGLWAGDGSVFQRKSGGWSLKFTNTSGGLLDQVQWILSRLGVVSIREKPTRFSKSTVDIASILITETEAIRAFAKTVTIPGVKGERLARAARHTPQRRNARTDRLPIEVTEEVTRLAVEADVRYINMKDVLGYKPQSKEMCREDLAVFADRVGAPHLRQLADSDVLWDEITSIEPDGEDETFDFSVPGPNNCVVANIFVHNSGDLENEADYIALLHRPNDPGPDKREDCELLIDKAKDGPPGVIHMVYDHDAQTFTPNQRGFVTFSG